MNPCCDSNPPVGACRDPASGRRSRHPRYALARAAAALGRPVPGPHAGRGGALRRRVDGCPGADALRDRTGDPERHRQPRQPFPRGLDARPARPRRDSGGRGSHASPLRRLELAPGLVQARAGRRAPCSAGGPCSPEHALHGRGRRHRHERCDARRGRLRHHRAVRRRDRRVLRRRVHPAVVVRRSRPRRPDRRAGARRACSALSSSPSRRGSSSSANRWAS